MKTINKTFLSLFFFIFSPLGPISNSWGNTGNSFYAAPNGSATGNGSINNPWDLQTALNESGTLKPGDTLFLRGGIYTKPATKTKQLPMGYIYISNLAGTSTNPIIVRSYQGEHAILDGGSIPQGNGGTITLDVVGSFTWYIDLEIESSSNEERKSAGGASFPPDITRADGIYIYGTGNKVINCVLHDMMAGLSPWGTASQFEAYGNLIYNNGWLGASHGQGHNVYTQNFASSSPKVFRDNIFLNAFDFNVQAYGTSKTQVVGYRFDNNFFINRPVLIGGYNSTPLADIQFTNNLGYKSSANFLYHEGTLYQDILVDSNYLVASGQSYRTEGWLNMAYWKNATVKNNTIITTSGAGTSCNAQITYPSTGGSYSNWSWDKNTYYGGGIFNISSSPFPNFSKWQTLTGFDKSSTMHNELPTVNKIVLRPNQYDPKRANLAIFNWENLNDVSVDVSNLGWANGDKYEVHNAADYFHDIAQGTYNGGGSIAINMLASAHTVQLPYGWPSPLPNTWVNTFPQFGAFILINENK